MVCFTRPSTTASTAIQNTQVISRQRRNRVQSDSFRWVIRSVPPNTRWVQK